MRMGWNRSVPAASDLGDKGILQKLEPFLREGKSRTWPRSQRGWGGSRREWRSWRPSCCFTLMRDHQISNQVCWGGKPISSPGLQLERDYTQKAWTWFRWHHFGLWCWNEMRLWGPWIEVNVFFAPWRYVSHEMVCCMWFANMELYTKDPWLQGWIHKSTHDKTVQICTELNTHTYIQTSTSKTGK